MVVEGGGARVPAAISPWMKYLQGSPPALALA